MKPITKEFRIGGMTCINCQSKIEKTLRKSEGIKEIFVSYSTGFAKVTFDPDMISFKEIKDIIIELDYEILSKDKTDQRDISEIISLLVIIIALFLLMQRFGILNRLVPSQLADSSMGYGMLFVIGLLTSVHCIAMCGGINLSQSIPNDIDEGNHDKKGIAFLPSVFYNFGRVISYTIVGFALGCAGMLLGSGSGTGLPIFVQGILKLIAGTFMIIMGINMLGIFPWLRKLNLRLPKFIAVKISKKKAVSKTPFMIGLLNGLMPCGPLQSMQIIALASGNPIIGALSMFFFSLGTVPLMLGLGSIVSAFGKKFARTVMSVGAVLVVVLGMAMFSQGSTLSGLFLIHPHASATDGESAEIIDGVQVVNSTLASGEYPDITVQEGIPVRWIIDAPDGSINGCNYKMIIQDYGIEYSFEVGENIIEFTPTEVGTVQYSCWMGMIRGNIFVTESESIETVEQ